MAKAEAVRNGKVSDPETGETVHLLGSGAGQGVLQPSTRPAQPTTSAPEATHGRGWGWNRGGSARGGGRTAEPDLESGIVEVRPEEMQDNHHGGRSDGRGGSTRDPRSQGRR